jgi:hypothetical protein
MTTPGAEGFGSMPLIEKGAVAPPVAHLRYVVVARSLAATAYELCPSSTECRNYDDPRP